ncbi:MAG: tetratricopeptide repeat protein [Candidatus Hydrogenedens sp.]|nr:tetratricopeptide repeat protein [Candidatus Hydrogenedens sp.]
MAKQRKKSQHEPGHAPPEESKASGGFLAGIPRTSALILAAIILLGALLRLGHLAEIRTQPDFDSPSADAAFKHYWARAILTGDTTPPPGDPDPHLATTPYVRPPAYPFFLAFIYLLTGTSFTAVRLVQIAAGLVSCLLLYRLGRRVFSESIGLLAAFLMSTYWIFIFFESELNEPALTVLLLLALMNLALDWSANPSYRRAGFTGLILGLLALMRTEIILFYPFALLWAIWRVRQLPLMERFMRAGAIGAVIVLCIAPVTLRNYLASGEFVPISTIGGLNLYAGNNPEATGYFPNLDYRELFGLSTSLSHMNFPQLVQALERKTGEENLGQSDLQNYFIRAAWDYVRNNPAQALATDWKKVLYFWGPAEISSNKIVALEKQNSVILRFLPPYFVFLSFGAVGVLMYLAGRRSGLDAAAEPRGGGVLSLAGLFILISFLTHVIFFVVARFRVPIIPFVLLFAAFALVQFVLMLRERDYFILARWVGALVVAFILFGVAWAPYTPDAVAYHYQRGLNYGHRGDTGKAIEEFKLAINAGREASQQDSVPVCSEMGFALAVQGEFDNAINWYDRALAIDPGHAFTLYRKGEAQLALDRVPQGIESLEAALKYDFTLAPAHMALVRAYVRRGRFADAEAAGKRAVEAVPGNIDLELLIGELLAQRGRPADALPYFERAIAIEPNNPRAYNYLGLQHAALGQFDQAIEAYEQAILIDPDSSITRTNLGNLYAHQGEYDKAIAHYLDALVVNPHDAGAEFGWGFVDVQRNEPDRAIERFRKAIEKNPEYTEAHNYLGYLLLQQNDLDDARFHLERAVRLNPNYILAHNNLGDCYLQLNLPDLAREQYEAVLQLEPGESYATEQLGKLTGTGTPSVGRHVITIPAGS